MPSYSEDVVIYGAAFRMVSFLDPSRLGPQSAAADMLDGVRPTGSGQNAARFLYNIYQQRLNEVADNQRRQHPIIYTSTVTRCIKHIFYCRIS